MTRENFSPVPTPFFPHAMVAFIDLLGFKAQVESLIQGGNILGLIDQIETIQRNFKKPEFVLGGESPADDLVLTDCVIAAIMLNGPLGSISGAEDACFDELHRLAYGQGECVRQGIFTRGGVATGFWYHQDDVVISDAQIEAYKIEQTSCVPMIALSKNLVDCLMEFLDETQPDPLRKDTIIHLSVNQPGSENSGRTLPFLNYLPIYAKFLEDHKDGRIEGFMEDHRDRISEALALHRGVPKLLHKYRFLAEYHNAFVNQETPPRSDWLISI